ncbi:MAG: hypothetical protein RDU25_04760 [Patescibacteria group bacterium]|nr:hypothetical protein [Patescibacteria group bacterium]
MKITIEVPDHLAPQLQSMVYETHAANLRDLLLRGMILYLYLFRTLGRGLRMFIFDENVEVVAQLDQEKLVNLTFDDADGSIPPEEPNNTEN